MVITKALVERGFSFPPSDFFSEILKAYGLQPHNISPNSVLAISNHVTLCEGHLRVTPELPLFQYYFTVKKEKIRQTSELATCGSITFMLRPGRVYPHTDRHESARYWSGSFFYLKDVSDPASDRKLPEFKNSPASETPAWTQCPHLSESPQLTRAVRRICKLTEEGLSGKDLTMSWFTKRIQPLQHRDHLMFHYTGRDDPMRATKDNLSADAIDKRIRLLIKIPRELHVHTLKPSRKASSELSSGSLTRGTTIRKPRRRLKFPMLRVLPRGRRPPPPALQPNVPARRLASRLPQKLRKPSPPDRQEEGQAVSGFYSSYSRSGGTPGSGRRWPCSKRCGAADVAGREETLPRAPGCHASFWRGVDEHVGAMSDRDHLWMRRLFLVLTITVLGLVCLPMAEPARSTP
ncbi:hypothetical protein QYE76_068857 [Lolium multiflorum]|uniref:Transposase (putative) gypsy type domain-containing protein n=1 Tax=Lolium multiflorum TaxID=4521 RepID=A0AAD8SF79_LOLMU|nr:hypothetical protein QYE76_068857 [Lolium multiflorum]